MRPSRAPSDSCTRPPSAAAICCCSPRLSAAPAVCCCTPRSPAAAAVCCYCCRCCCSSCWFCIVQIASIFIITPPTSSCPPAGRSNLAILQHRYYRYKTGVIVDPGTSGDYTLCTRDGNNSQEPESETRVTKRGRKDKYNEGKK